MAYVLKRGGWYRARFVIDDPIGAATPSMISGALKSVGFDKVRAWMRSEELPSDWREGNREDIAGFMERTAWVEGMWDGRDDVPLVESGDGWKLYDVWEYDPSGDYANGYHKSEVEGGSRYGLALAVTAGVFLMGLPVALVFRSAER